MDTEASLIIKALGGVTAVSALTFAPVSTVHSWTRKGLSPSRRDHIELAAKARGKGHLLPSTDPSGEERPGASPVEEAA